MNPKNDESKEDVFDFYCVIELFGHQRIAGRLTEKPKGSTIFFQVDVPDPTTGNVKYSRIVNASSIYAINPTTKETVMKLCTKPGYDLNRPAIPYIPMPERPEDPIPSQGAFVSAQSEPEDEGEWPE